MAIASITKPTKSVGADISAPTLIGSLVTGCYMPGGFARLPVTNQVPDGLAACPVG
ncbi:Uncharacterised protein [Trueperella bialowiezensis]|uniref:Uncharacterized protein n=1 Tax=Trueperella bialowiezensis TaxID=312285 RepID=A0A3S4YYB0_9ACTO|nr:Uncharacterised protein [Trueperella bialowiezensis]